MTNYTTSFFEKNIKSIGITLAVALVVGLGFTLYNYRQTAHETNLQEQYFIIEVKIKKMKDAQFKASQENKADAKVVTKTEPTSISTAELQAELEAFINTAKKTVAGQMAALELAHILVTENKPEMAIEWLNKVETGSSNLTNLLVRMKKAQALSVANKCADAIIAWDKVVADSKAQFLHIEAKVNQALCYKSMNDLAKAEDVLLKIKSNSKNGEYSAEKNPDVDKVLRLIQFQKNAGI